MSNTIETKFVNGTIEISHIPASLPILDYTLTPCDGEVFSDDMKAVVLDCAGGTIIDTLTLGDGIQRVTPQQVLDNEDFNDDTIILSFTAAINAPHQEVIVEFTGVNVGVLEIVFNLKYVSTNL